MDESFRSSQMFSEVPPSVPLVLLLLLYVFTTPTLMIFLYLVCWKINFTFSRPALLHSMPRACTGRISLKNEQSSSSCMNSHQETESQSLKSRFPRCDEPQEINIGSNAPWMYISFCWLPEIKSIIYFLLNLPRFYGKMLKNRRSSRETVTTVSPRSASHWLNYKSFWTIFFESCFGGFRDELTFLVQSLMF